jgi:hypothetical protein
MISGNVTGRCMYIVRPTYTLFIKVYSENVNPDTNQPDEDEYGRVPLSAVTE